MIWGDKRRKRVRKADGAARPKSPGRWWRPLIWSTIICALLGAIDFGRPIDDALNSMRDMVRTHPSRGDVVVIAIDGRTLDSMPGWPWPRRYHAKLIDRLQALGARRIALDLVFGPSHDPADDGALTASLARTRMPVILASGFNEDPATGAKTGFTAPAAFRPHVALATINVRYDAQGTVWKLPYALGSGATQLPSMAASLSGVAHPAQGSFPIDYAIALRSVPSVSAIDVLQGRVSPGRLAGKDVIVGTAAMRLGDTYLLPRHGMVSGVYLHALGAETLREGIPMELGWIPAFLLALLSCALQLAARRARVARVAAAGAAAVLILLPLALERALIHVDVVPALMLLAWVAIGRAWRRHRNSHHAEVTTNAGSGLPNLSALPESEIVPGSPLVVARVRNFAEIIATLPPGAEGQLAEQIARRLFFGSQGTRVHQGDNGIFVWFGPELGEDAATIGLDALHGLFLAPIAVEGRRVDVSIAFGIDDDGARSLPNRLGSAIMAADEAARDGLRWKRYDPSTLEDASWRLSLLSSLDAAIDVGEVWVAFQPKYDLRARRVSGAEALARWTHPERGEISPMEFITVAEQHNRILKLTLHILAEALAGASSILATGEDFKIAVNLSARLLEEPTIVAAIGSMLARYRFDPGRLVLEITETAAVGSGAASIQILRELRDLGITLSIDDYGTGFSNLENLRIIPADEIKIDRSFVDMVGASASEEVMVRSTIQLAHSLGRRVVAEGVERPETLAALEAMECDEVQGYLIGKPMRIESLRRLLIANRQRSTARHS